MIDESRTLELFGYTSDGLSHASHKKVIAVCDECGKVRILSYRQCGNLCYDCAMRSEETRKKMSVAQKGEKNASYGKAPSDETRKRMSIAQKGRKPSIETRKKISEGQKGKKLSDETKKKISAAAKGRKPSIETRKKMSEQRTGRKNTDESRKNMSAAQNKSWATGQRENTCGDNNPNWQGGKSFEPYCHKFGKSFKESVREKFNRTCFLCPTTEAENGRKLSVHHVNYDKNCLCDDAKCEFVPLCDQCHGKTNYDREYWENLIMEKLKAFSQRTETQ